MELFWRLKGGVGGLVVSRISKSTGLVYDGMRLSGVLPWAECQRASLIPETNHLRVKYKEKETAKQEKGITRGT